MAVDKETRLCISEAMGGNPKAQFKLGNAYLNGRGLPQDHDKALSWYLKAAAQDHSGAQNNVGLMYDKGYGVLNCSEEAARWYLKAARNGSVVAQNNMGVTYEHGRGVPQSLEEAVRWYRAAADRGNESAQKNLARLGATSLSVEKSDPRDSILSRERIKNSCPCEALLTASTPTIYLDNAFRITGLAVNATPREIKRRIDDLKAAYEMGDSEDEQCHAFALDPPPTMEQIREASLRLKDPEKRIIDEFFWFWPEEWGNGKCDPMLDAIRNGDKKFAFSKWNEALSDDHSIASKVARHNLAVMYQLSALDFECLAIKNDQIPEIRENVRDYWSSSYRLWEEITEDEVFWSLLAERIRMHDDPRLTTGFARRMRATFPDALNKINAMLAISFIEKGKIKLADQHLDLMLEIHEGMDDVAGTMALVAEPLLNRLRIGIEHAAHGINGSAESAESSAANLLQLADEPVRILKQFMPADDQQLGDLCDAVANTCLRCHRAMIRKANDAQSQWDQAITILERAITFASSVEIEEEIEEARKDATLSKQMAHPMVRQIIDLLQRAERENQRDQLKTLGKEVAGSLTALGFEARCTSSTYRTAADLVARALRSLSVELINKGQEQISKVLDVLGDEQQLREMAINAREGGTASEDFERRRRGCLVDIAIGIDLYDRGNELACSPELKEQFEEDAQALESIRDIRNQFEYQIYHNREASDLLFQWGSERPAPPPKKTSSTSPSALRGGCFVATAVYGSYDHSAVRILRFYRDETLLRSSGGRALVALYYSIGPSLAIAVRRNSMAVSVVRRILDVVVGRIIRSRRYRLHALQQTRKGTYDKKE